MNHFEKNIYLIIMQLPNTRTCIHHITSHHISHHINCQLVHSCSSCTVQGALKLTSQCDSCSCHWWPLLGNQTSCTDRGPRIRVKDGFWACTVCPSNCNLLSCAYRRQLVWVSCCWVQNRVWTLVSSYTRYTAGTWYPWNMAHNTRGDSIVNAWAFWANVCIWHTSEQ